jgi:hypothetical protein
VGRLLKGHNPGGGLEREEMCLAGTVLKVKEFG